ncbi:methyltransferase domain-containing protein [bacterium]|nr:methyltransferase domain-containing protein [bacterium]
MAANFDPVARWYRFLEMAAFGGALQRCRIALLDEVKTAERVLIVGEGNGRFLEALLQSNPVAKITVIDASQRMINLARERVNHSPRVTFVHASLLDAATAIPSVDLVVTDFFLDCFNESEMYLATKRLRGALENGGRWLWSDFAIPESGFMKLWSRTVVALLYDFFRLATGISARRLIDPHPRFTELKMNLIERRVLSKGLLASALYEVK